jgi:hypothetical protein
VNQPWTGASKSRAASHRPCQFRLAAIEVKNPDVKQGAFEAERFGRNTWDSVRDLTYKDRGA